MTTTPTPTSSVLSANFETLDRQYPGSRFIFTTRDVDSWIESRRNHVERNVARKALGQYKGHFLHVDEPAWRRQWIQHQANVRSYFAERPGELLLMDIIGGDGYEKLCPFLGVPLASTSFPWRHLGSRRTADQP